MKLFKKEQKNEAKNKEPNEIKCITENMGEITFKNIGFKYIYGKYNSEEIQIANLGLISHKFKENFDYIMNVINQYGKIYEISKKAIIENFNNDDGIRRFFFPYNFLKGEEFFKLIHGDKRSFLRLCESREPEEVLKLCGIDVFDGFDINKAVDKLKYPRLYFADNPSGWYGGEKIYFEVQYRMVDETDESDLVLQVIMDSKLEIYCFDCCSPIPIYLK